KAIYGRVTARNGVIASAYKYVAVDLASKKETPLNVPGDFLLARCSPDGKWLLGYQYTNFQHWQRYTLADGKLHSIANGPFHAYMDLSPDGKTLIGYGQTRKGVIGGPQPPRGVNRFDVETGAMTTGDRWAGTSEDLLAISRWSPDGKRIAHAVRERN